jgi:hypothetical protein
LKKVSDLPKHHQRPWLSPVAVTAKAWPQEETVCFQWPSREFLGARGFCRIWIPNHFLSPRPLHETTKPGEQEPLVWEEEPEKAFREIKRALTNALALGLPGLMKPLFLYVHE